MDFRYVASGDFGKDLRADYARLARAGKKTIEDAAAIVRTGATAQLAAAGFGARWQRGLQTEIYPREGRTSLNAQVWIKHRINFFGVHEYGATIAGKSLLCIPLPNVPKREGGRPLSPQEYQRRLGPLRLIHVGSKIYLVGKVSRSTVLRATRKKITLRKKFRAAGGIPQEDRAVPLYVCVPQVTIPKRFDIGGIVRDTAAQVPAMFAQNVERER